MRAGWVFLCVAGTAGAQVEAPVDPFGDNPPPLRVGLIAEPGKGGERDIEAKLRETVIPQVEFVETPLEDALEFLRIRAIELDHKTMELEERGINIVLNARSGFGNPKLSLDDDKPFSFALDEMPRITLKLHNVSLGGALRYVADSVGLEMRVEREAVVLATPGEDVAGLVSSLRNVETEAAGWSDEGLWAGTSGANLPGATMLEALQSEYRRLKVLDERYREKGVPEDDPDRLALAGRMEAARAAILKARKLLLEFWEAERKLGEAWMEESR